MDGKIIVYTGPMFSSKSMMMVYSYERAIISGKKVLAFKPAIDNRFGDNVIQSRSGIVIPANNICNIAELRNYDADVFVIDEFEFLQGDVSIIEEMANEGKVFYIAGLDMTAEGKPFGPMPQICAYADKVIKEVAICVDCKMENATHSFYLGKKSQDIELGDKEYIALCRSCWRKRMIEKG